MQPLSDKDFIQLLENNKDKIYRICRVYAVSPIEPSDLFQEVVYQVWKSYTSFHHKSEISTWIYRIALNVCLRSKMKLEKSDHKRVKLDAIHFEPLEVAPDEGQMEKLKALHACIATLNETDQSIIILYLEELSYKQIATITGLTENHIAVKMKRIRKKLFECITPKIQ